MPVAGVTAAPAGGVAAPPVGGVGSGVWGPPCPCWVASTVSAAGAAAVGVSSSSSPPQLTSSSALSDSAATAEARRPCKRSFRPGIVTIRHPPKLVGPGGRLVDATKSRGAASTSSQYLKRRTVPRAQPTDGGCRSAPGPLASTHAALRPPRRSAPEDSPTSRHESRHRAFAHRAHSLHRSARRG